MALGLLLALVIGSLSVPLLSQTAVLHTGLSPVTAPAKPASTGRLEYLPATSAGAQPADPPSIRSNAIASGSPDPFGVVGTVPTEGATGVAYDSGRGEVFVANGGCNYPPFVGGLSVINDTSQKVVATVPTGCNSEQVVYDSKKGEVFTTNYSKLVGVSDSNNSVVTTISDPDGAVGLAYDSGKGELFVTGYGPNVTVVSDSSDSIVAEIPAGATYSNLNGSTPAYDATLGEVFVPDWTAGSVSVISDSTDRVVATIPVQDSPNSAVWDPAKAEVFVADGYAGNVSIISTATNAVVTTVPIGPFPVTVTPFGLAYDPARGEVFVGDSSNGFGGLNNVTAISDESDTVVGSWVIGANPMSIAYDSGTHQVYVADSWAGNVSILANGYTAMFSESGLAAGVYWTIEMDGQTLSSASSSITFVTANGTHAFAVGRGIGYNATPKAGNITVGGSGVSTEINFVLAVYAVTFQELGLPAGTNWSVNLSGSLHTSVGGSITFGRSNGSYLFAANTSLLNLTLAPASGEVTVTSNPQTINLTAIRSYAVNFTEAGLPAGSEWSVTLGGTPWESLGSTIGFAEQNGTYAFSVAQIAGYVWTPAAGNVTVHGHPVAVSLLLAATHSVSFNESGLPAGTPWTVTLGGLHNSSTGSSMTFVEVNGTYAFAVTPIAGYIASTWSGNLSVNGSAVTQNLTFQAATYTVTFNQSGLPIHSNWSVTVNGLSKYSLGQSISFVLPNGSYQFSVFFAGDYELYPGSSDLLVYGAPVSIPVFAELVSFVVFTESGLPSPAEANWSVTINGQVIRYPGPELIAVEPNGTYWFTVSGSQGYTASPSSGFLTVEGFELFLAVNFTAPQPSAAAPPGEGLLGMPGYGGLFLIVWSVSFSVLLVVLVAWRTRTPPPQGYVAGPPSAPRYPPRA